MMTPADAASLRLSLRILLVFAGCVFSDAVIFVGTVYVGTIGVLPAKYADAFALAYLAIQVPLAIAAALTLRAVRLAWLGPVLALLAMAAAPFAIFCIAGWVTAHPAP